MAKLFSKRHYEVVARLLNKNRPVDNASDDAMALWGGLVADFSIYFGGDNAQFDHQRFTEACNKD